jgi:hypothetical protein
MIRLAPPVLLLAALLAPPDLAAEPPPAPRRVVLARDLAAFPAGAHELVQTYELHRTTRIEQHGKDSEKDVFRQTQSLEFDVDYAPPAGDSPGSLAFTVRRTVFAITEGDGARHAYDSAGEPDAQSPVLAEQFGTIVGTTSRAEVAAAGVGAFSGLDAAWDRFGEKKPGHARTLAQNKRNFGDARLTRLLLRGDALLGIRPVTADEAKASDRPRRRALAVGETWDVTDSITGPHGEPLPIVRTCRLESVREGVGTIRVGWEAEKGPLPRVVEGGGIDVRAVRENGSIEVGVHLASGVVVTWWRRVVTTRQRAVPGLQVTVTATDKEGFRLVRKRTDED